MVGSVYKMADFVANLLPNAALSAVGLQPGFQTAGIGEVSSGSLFAYDGQSGQQERSKVAS